MRIWRLKIIKDKLYNLQEKVIRNLKKNIRNEASK